MWKVQNNITWAWGWDGDHHDDDEFGRKVKDKNAIYGH